MFYGQIPRFCNCDLECLKCLKISLHKSHKIILLGIRNAIIERSIIATTLVIPNVFVALSANYEKAIKYCNFVAVYLYILMRGKKIMVLLLKILFCFFHEFLYFISIFISNSLCELCVNSHNNEIANLCTSVLFLLKKN